LIKINIRPGISAGLFYALYDTFSGLILDLCSFSILLLIKFSIFEKIINNV